MVDYGVIEVATDNLGVEQATMVALRQFRDMANAGWPKGSAGGQRMELDWALADAGYMIDIVYTWARESGHGLLASIGRSAGQQRQQYVSKQTTTGPSVVVAGGGYHINHLPVAQTHLVEIDADHWKTWVHQRFLTPMGNAGAMTLFQGTIS